ncbi:hypothetical protein, partial [Paraburkholderia hospita]
EARRQSADASANAGRAFQRKRKPRMPAQTQISPPVADEKKGATSLMRKQRLRFQPIPRIAAFKSEP